MDHRPWSCETVEGYRKIRKIYDYYIINTPTTYISVKNIYSGTYSYVHPLDNVND